MDTKTSRYQKGLAFFGWGVKWWSVKLPQSFCDHGGKSLTCWRKASSYGLMGWATAAFRLFWRGIPGKSGPERPCMEEFPLSWEGLWLWSQQHRHSHTYWQFYLEKCCLPTTGERQYPQVARIPQCIPKQECCEMWVLWDKQTARIKRSQGDREKVRETGDRKRSQSLGILLKCRFEFQGSQMRPVFWPS